jgi:hypothetical protein
MKVRRPSTKIDWQIAFLQSGPDGTSRRGLFFCLGLEDGGTGHRAPMPPSLVLQGAESLLSAVSIPNVIDARISCLSFAGSIEAVSRIEQ